MKDIYQSELEWMQDFYKELGIIPDYSLNTDWRIAWNLLEFKLVFTNLKEHKQQIKKYITAYNSWAYDIPKRSYLISINERQYIKINNETNAVETESEWSNPQDFKVELFNQTEYLQWRIDEYSIVSYNNKLCRDFKQYFKSKEHVKNEFISPHFLNIKPFEWEKQMKAEEKNKDEIWWLHFNMNMLWPNLLKKQLWAFFTPDKYVKISTEMVRNAIKKVPEWNDYIILDRCAWTWDLEKFLTEEELSHCVLNTIDYTEWTTLKWLYEWRAKMIIPPTHKTLTEQWLLKDWDALSEDFHNYKPLNDLISNEKITVILLENPPYSDTSADNDKQMWARNEMSWVNIQMKDDLHKFNVSNISTARELCNWFIWSGFKYYLRQPTDQAIIYSPIKYRKSIQLIDKLFVDWYLCNRKEFNSSEWWIALIHWMNQDKEQESIQLDSDIKNKKINIKKVYTTQATAFYDKRKDWFAYMQSNSFRLSKWKDILYNDFVKANRWNYLNNDNILKLLPLWVSDKYETKDYTEIEVIMKSGDWWDKYQDDNEFLKACFIRSCISQKNKCISNNKIKNQLCFAQNTEADKILQKFDMLDNEDMNLFWLRKNVLNEAKKTKEWHNWWNYWLYQIDNDINIDEWTNTYTKTWKEIMRKKYLKLDENIKKLKDELKNYYQNRIEKKLFEYELLK